MTDIHTLYGINKYKKRKTSQIVKEFTNFTHNAHVKHTAHFKHNTLYTHKKVYTDNTLYTHFIHTTQTKYNLLLNLKGSLAVCRGEINEFL